MTEEVIIKQYAKSYKDSLLENWHQLGSRMYWSHCGQLSIHLVEVGRDRMWEIRDVNERMYFERFDERQITIALSIANDLIAENKTVFPS